LNFSAAEVCYPSCTFMKVQRFVFLYGPANCFKSLSFF
jgi:hypothetical protein